MKTEQELIKLANAVLAIPSADFHAEITRILRSIELDAWREARAIVEKHGIIRGGAHAPNEALPEMDRLIQQLQFK